MVQKPSIKKKHLNIGILLKIYIFILDFLDKISIFRKTNFAKLNTDALFKAVDVDNSGTIEEEEWIEFWREVKRAGHSEKEIEEEVILIIFLYYEKQRYFK